MAYTSYGSKKEVVSIFAVLALLLIIFFFGMVRYSSPVSTAALGVITIFIISIIKIEIGLVFLVLSMLFSPEISLGTIGTRSIVVRLEDLLIPVLFLAWVGQAAIKRERKMFIKTPLNPPIFTYIAICIISTVKGCMSGYLPPMRGLLFNLKIIEFFFIYFFVVNLIKTRRQVRFFLTAALIVGLAISLYGLYQVPTVEIWTIHRISAPFEGNPEPATVGGYLMFLLAIAISLLLYAPTPQQKWGYMLLSTLIIIPLIYTLSRVTYISTIFMLFILSVFSKKKYLIFFLTILLLLSPFILPQKIMDRILYTWRDAREYGVDQSAGERIYSWKKTVNDARMHPFFGYGVSVRDIKDNHYLRVVTETGLIGLLAFLWILLRIYKCSVRLFKQAEKGWVKALSLGYIAGFIGILIHSLGTITFNIVRIMEPFWFFTGMIMFLYLSYYNAGKEDSPV